MGMEIFNNMDKDGNVETLPRRLACLDTTYRLPATGMSDCLVQKHCRGISSRFVASNSPARASSTPTKAICSLLANQAPDKSRHDRSPSRGQGELLRHSEVLPAVSIFILLPESTPRVPPTTTNEENNQPTCLQTIYRLPTSEVDQSRGPDRSRCSREFF